MMLAVVVSNAADTEAAGLAIGRLECDDLQSIRPFSPEQCAMIQSLETVNANSGVDRSVIQHADCQVTHDLATQAMTAAGRTSVIKAALCFKRVTARLMLFIVAGSLLLLANPCRADDSKQPLRIGMIGLDTSHVIAFTKAINSPQAHPDLAGVKITAAYPGGSPTFPASRDRLAGFTNQVRAMGVEIVDSIPELLEKVDVVMLESVDGSQHLEQIRRVFASGKRVFIDKPFAASLVDAVAIYELGRRHSASYFSSSPKRFSQDLTALLGEKSVGAIMGCDVYGTSKSVPNHPDLFWYGVHGSEMLFTVMGPGCVTVTARQTPFAEQVAGIWNDGRVGTFRGIREAGGRNGFGATVFGAKKIQTATIGGDKDGIMRELVHFFKTGEPPVPPEETLEIFAFMAAAEESKSLGGIPVAVEDVLKRARIEAHVKISNGKD